MPASVDHFAHYGNFGFYRRSVLLRELPTASIPAFKNSSFTSDQAEDSDDSLIQPVDQRRRRSSGRNMPYMEVPQPAATVGNPGNSGWLLAAFNLPDFQMRRQFTRGSERQLHSTGDQIDE